MQRENAMYAVIETGGKQYAVEVGQMLKIESRRRSRRIRRIRQSFVGL